MAYFEVSSFAWVLIGAALFFNVVFTSLYYMIATMLSSPTQTALAKENIGQLIASGFIIIAFIIFANGLLPPLMGSIVCYGSPTDCASVDHIKVAHYSLNLLETTIMNMYSKLYLFEVVVAILSSISMTFGVFRVFLFVFSIHISPFIALTLIANVQVIVVEAIGYMWGMTTAKLIILEMVQYAIPTVFLPLGLFLRAIPWLRGTGSTILALCFSMYFIFPLAVTFSNYIIFDLFKATPTYINFDNPSPMTQICGDAGNINVKDLTDELNEMENEAAAMAKPQTTFLGKIWSIIKAVASAVASIFMLLIKLVALLFKGGSPLGFLNPFSYLKTYYYYLILEMSLAAQFLVTVLISTILEFILIVTAHRSISAAIGGETEMFGLSKII